MPFLGHQGGSSVPSPGSGRGSLVNQGIERGGVRFSKLAGGGLGLSGFWAAIWSAPHLAVCPPFMCIVRDTGPELSTFHPLRLASFLATPSKKFNQRQGLGWWLVAMADGSPLSPESYSAPNQLANNRARTPDDENPFFRFKSPISGNGAHFASGALKNNLRLWEGGRANTTHFPTGGGLQSPLSE